MPAISVALLQITAHARDEFVHVWPGIRDLVEREAIGGARIIVAPECTIPGYVIGTAPLDRTLVESALADLQAISDVHGCVVVIGVARSYAGGTHGARNSAAVVAPHAPLLYSDKRFLWHFDSLWFDAGEDIAPVPTPFGSLGIIICADGRIPLIARTLVERGAELLVVVTAWVTSGRDVHALENVQADLLAAIRARENARPLIAANKAGCERESVLYCGKSQIVDANGDVLAIASQHDAEVVRGNVSITAAAPRRYAPLILTPLERPQNATRIGIASAIDADALQVAAYCETDAVIAHRYTGTVRGANVVELAGLAQPCIVSLGPAQAVCVSGAAIMDPAYLVQTRLQGYDLYVWQADSDEIGVMALARSRAVELRAYLIVFYGDAVTAIDPNGVPVAGTGTMLKLAQFFYDPQLTNATTIVPHTDILEGLQAALAFGRHRA